MDEGDKYEWMGWEKECMWMKEMRKKKYMNDMCVDERVVCESKR